MTKFSFIVPVYKTEKYLNKCLSSLINQPYSEYEIIVVNDGSPDNSQTIIDEYKKKSDKIRSYLKENGGLSDARNYGVKKATGDYLIFVDSDDYVNENMLHKISEVIEKNTDIVKFNFAYVINEDIIEEKDDLILNNESGPISFAKLVDHMSAFEMAWLYAYKRSFWLSNNFSYAKGTYHEDFGLTPYVLIKAKKVKSINDILYYYVKTDNSITTSVSITNIKKRAWDILYHFDHLLEIVKNDSKIDNYVRKVFNSFIANAVINKAQTLDDELLEQYLIEVKKRNISKLMLGNSVNRILKKIIIKLDPKLYLKRRK